MREIGRKDCFCQKVKIVLLALFLSVFSYSCETAPITERNQVILVPYEMEIQMGQDAFQEIIRNERISTNLRYNAAVGRVMSRVARVANRPDFDWEYAVIDDANINAFALPGGKIGIYSGILKVAQTDAGLATVVSHEVAHVVARHSVESSPFIHLGVHLGAVVLTAAFFRLMKIKIGEVGRVWIYRITWEYVIKSVPFSRTQESEADRIGLIYMARAGYDPREAVKFWQRMAELEGRSQVPELLSTHPDNGTRIENLLKHMPEALAIYKRSDKAPTPNYRIAW